MAARGFVWIPSGSFLMGDQSDPRVGVSEELPLHSVYVSGFYMGKCEVTYEVWDAVRTWGSSNGYTDLPPGASKGANHPVHLIDWCSIIKWCNARSEYEDLHPCYLVDGTVFRSGGGDLLTCNIVTCDWNANGYRLPSEAEWEKAARGGLSGKSFPWGDTITHDQANY